jgi:hypothetical protein
VAVRLPLLLLVMVRVAVWKVITGDVAVHPDLQDPEVFGAAGVVDRLKLALPWTAGIFNSAPLVVPLPPLPGTGPVSTPGFLHWTVQV